MINPSFRYVPSKKGIPLLSNKDPLNDYAEHWEKVIAPDNTPTNDIKKEFWQVHKKRWGQLTDQERTGIYNHTLKHTTNIKCSRGSYYAYLFTGEKNDIEYIFQEHKGNFTIHYNGAAYELFFNDIFITAVPYQCTTILNKPQKEIQWLKRFAQYLIDEPGDLNVLICRQIPIAPYVNIPCINEVPA